MAARREVQSDGIGYMKGTSRYSLIPHSPAAGVEPWRPRLLLALMLLLSSGLSIALFGVRVLYSGNTTFFFLNWNLFLAWIPLLAAAAAWALQAEADRPRLRVTPLLALWLLFLPNAPYILTDLIHLAPRNNVPLWYDLLLLLSYAWNGLILGFVSLWIVQGLLQRWFGPAVGWAGAAAAIFLAAFGIYLGRFLRWNSWDILTQPVDMARRILSAATNPAAHKEAVVITLLLCGILGAMYVTLALLSSVRNGAWEE